MRNAADTFEDDGIEGDVLMGLGSGKMGRTIEAEVAIVGLGDANDLSLFNVWRGDGVPNSSKAVDVGLGGVL